MASLTPLAASGAVLTGREQQLQQKPSNFIRSGRDRSFISSRNNNNPIARSPMLVSTVKAVGGGVGVGGGGVAKYKGTQRREKQLTEMIEKKVMEAKEICEGDATSDECKVAWDEVEEVSQAKADLRLKLEVEKKDPLEYFCKDNPETDECRIYED